MHPAPPTTHFRCADSPNYLRDSPNYLRDRKIYLKDISIYLKDILPHLGSIREIALQRFPAGQHPRVTIFRHLPHYYQKKRTIMKKFLSLAVLLMAAFVGFTACDNDDEYVEDILTVPGNSSMPGYTILSKNTYTKKQYGDLLLTEFMKYISTDKAPASVKALTQMYLNNMMSALPDETQFTVVNFNYRSFTNTYVDMSGQIIVPTIGNKILKDTLVIDNRFTQLKNSEVPTKRLNVGASIATTGCPVVTCDMAGYGTSRGERLNYHCYHLTSRNTIDAALAGIAVLHGPELGLDISDEPLPVYNEGYSQGGYGAMSVLKYLENDATDFEKQQLPLIKTVCGAGAYDPTRMLQVIIDRWDEVYPYYCYIAAAFETSFWYHHDWYRGSSWEITMKDIFSSKAYATRLNDMVNSHMYNTSEICNAFTEAMGGNEKCRAYDVLALELFDTHTRVYQTVMEKGKNESLVEGWVPKSRLHFYHAKNDEAVPVQCAQLARTKFGNGATGNITYDIDTDVTKLLGFIDVEGLQPHTVGYFNFIIQNILEDLQAKPNGNK